MIISIIVGVGKNNQIGKDNKLLWHISEDLKNFKRLTMNHIMIMGRKTFDSIGKPLPGRTSYVISRNPDLKIDGACVFNSLSDAIQKAKESGEEECFIIGGAAIYEQALESCDRIYFSEISYDGEADTFFPKLSKEWKAVDEPQFLETNSDLECKFSILER